MQQFCSSEGETGYKIKKTQSFIVAILDVYQKQSLLLHLSDAGRHQQKFLNDTFLFPSSHVHADIYCFQNQPSW